jgi:hypothetical protein
MIVSEHIALLSPHTCMSNLSSCYWIYFYGSVVITQCSLHLFCTDAIYFLTVILFIVKHLSLKSIKILFLHLSRAEKCVIASSGFQGDIKALQKNLSAKELVKLAELHLSKYSIYSSIQVFCVISRVFFLWLHKIESLVYLFWTFKLVLRIYYSLLVIKIIWIL